MSAMPDEVRAVVAKFRSIPGGAPEDPFVVACMSLGTWDVIGEDEWQAWRRGALDAILPDWEGSYEIREVVLRIPQEPLDALFAVEAIDTEVQS